MRFNSVKELTSQAYGIQRSTFEAMAALLLTSNAGGKPNTLGIEDQLS